MNSQKVNKSQFFNKHSLGLSIQNRVFVELSKRYGVRRHTLLLINELYIFDMRKFTKTKAQRTINWDNKLFNRHWKIATEKGYIELKEQSGTRKYYQVSKDTEHLFKQYTYFYNKYAMPKADKIMTAHREKYYGQG